MKITILILALASQLIAQVETTLLTVYVGNGSSPENAFRPLIADKISMGWTDLTSVELPDSVGLIVIQATYDQSVDALVRADTSAFVLTQRNDMNLLSAFLLRKKNGVRLSNTLRLKPNATIADVIAELKTIDREKKRRRAR